MAKPQVQVLTPKVIYVGRKVRIDIEITADKPTKCDAIRARLRGTQGWAVGSGKSRRTRQVNFPEALEFELSGPTQLAAGVATPFQLEFTLPQGMPPSHDLSPAYAGLELKVHVSIPWRIDGRYRYWLPVGITPPAKVERTPFAVRSNSSTAPADKPRIEVSLASTRLIAGETLVGTCAVFHMDDRDEREVELSLVPMLTLHGTRDRERRATALVSKITLPAGSAGKGIPFKLALPRTMTSSFETVTHDLAWWLVARTGSFFGGRVDVSVPLEILDPSAAESTARLQEAPRLGDERIATLFASYAAKHGWRGGDPEDEVDEPAGQFSIEREAGESRLRIAYDYRGEDGTFIVGRVDHRALGLNLAVSPSSTVRHVFWRDIEVDISAWDRAHHVAARSAEQALPFLRAVVPQLVKSPNLGALLRWGDSEMVFERPLTTLGEPELRAMDTELAAIAAMIEVGELQIPPPAGVDVDLVAWRELAQRCKGHLALGDLSITGTFDGVPVELTPEWPQEGMFGRLRVGYGDPDLASDALRAVSLSLAKPAADVLGRDVAESLVELLTGCRLELRDLRVHDGVASVSLVTPTAKLDATAARETIETLRAVLSALAPGSGPYR